MNRRTGVMMVLVTAVLALMFLAAPAAQAACTDGAGPGVDWSGCTKNFVFEFNTDMSGANLSNATISNASFINVNLSNANLDGTVFDTVSFLTVDFTGATGTPASFTNASGSGITCPLGEPGSTTAPFCAWQPAAVTLGQTGAAAVPALWPAALFGLLLLGTAGLWLARRDAARTAVSL